MSAAVTRRPWRAWTDDEYALLAEYESAPTAELARMLDRTPNTVRGKRRELRLGIVRWADGIWSDDEDAIVRETPHLTAVQLAALLGRGVKSVEHRRSYLGIGAYINKDPNRVGARALIARTCPGCGLFLNARWFLLEGTKRKRQGENWSVYCRKCKHTRTPRIARQASDQARARIRANYHARQKVSSDVATRHRSEYAEQDHAVLSNPDYTNLEKAVRIQRTYAAVVGAVKKFDYRSRRGLGSIDRDQWLIYFEQVAS